MLLKEETKDNKPHDYCGLAGAFSSGSENVTNTVIEIGKALQHRGQNGAGIAVKNRGMTMKVYKKAQAFNELFRSPDLLEENALRGEVAMAHLRYPTEGTSRQNCDAGPFHASWQGWELALGHNGSIVEVARHKKKLDKFGIKLESDSDSEIIAWLIATAPGATWKQKITSALTDVKGAYSLVMVTGDGKLLALRDPWGVRPLVWTQDNGFVFVSSETCGLDRINIRHSQRLKPGQLLVADENGVTVSSYTPLQKHSFCVFEKLYFSHDTSVWDGVIGENRESLGKNLALEEIERVKSSQIKKETLQNIDYIVAVPDTAASGAHAFYEELKESLPFAIKLRYKQGLVKERYDWAKRSFIEDDPYLRQKDVEKKFFISPSIIGKSIYLVDDTAVRLNTFSILVAHLLKVGVREVHCRFLAPKFLNPCFLGVNIGTRNELGAVKKEKGVFKELKESEIAKKLNVSSLHYLSLAGLAKSLGMTTSQLHKSHCTGCLDYHNPFDMRKFDPEFIKTSYLHKTKTKTKKTKIFPSKSNFLPINA